MQEYQKLFLELKFREVLLEDFEKMWQNRVSKLNFKFAKVNSSHKMEAESTKVWQLSAKWCELPIPPLLR